MNNNQSNKSSYILKLENTDTKDNTAPSTTANDSNKNLMLVTTTTQKKKHRKKKLLSQDKYQSILKYLQETYPKCFTNPPIPLAIDIHNILKEQLADKFPKGDITKFLKIYTTSHKYKKTLILGANRYNLDGSVSSKVTEEETNDKSTKKYLKSDALFKSILEDKVAAIEFLDNYLPADFKELLDLNTAKLEKETFVEEHLARKLSDVVFSIKTKDDDEAFIYTLIEHQDKVRRESCINNCLALDETRYTASDNLSAHALLATARCEAAETMNLCVLQAASREVNCYLRVPMRVEG